MSKKGLRKAISTVLVLALLVALMPAMLVSAAEVGDAVTFSFTKASASLGTKGTDYSYWTEAEGASKEDTYLNTKSVKNYYNVGTNVRNWRYFADTMADGVNPYTATSATLASGGSSYGNWIAFKVKGINEGQYSVALASSDLNRGCVIGMYMLDNSIYGEADTTTITEAIDSTLGSGVTKLSEVDFFGNTQSTGTATYTFGNVNLAGGIETEHIVVLKMERAGELTAGETSSQTKSEPRLYFNKLTFTYVSEYVAPPEVATEKTISFTKEDSGLSDISGAVNLMTYVTGYEDGVRDWKYFTGYCVTSTNHHNSATASDSAGISMNGGAHRGDWIAIKVRGLAESDYKITYNKNTAAKRGCVWAMYVLDNSIYGEAAAATITDAIDNVSEGVTRVGEFDLFGNSATAIEVGNVKLSGKSTTEHIILLRAERDGVLSDGETALSGYETTGAYIAMLGLTFTPVDAADMANDAFAYEETEHTGGGTSVVAYAVYGTDGTVSETERVETPDVVYGEVCTVSAPETATVEEESYTFLYWAKGMTMERKQIVSREASFDYLPREGANYLMAVYGKDSAETDSKTEFYNANGQFLSDVEAENGAIPGYPSMAGYGKARAWALRNGDGSYTEYSEGDTAPAGGMFIAVYDDPVSDIEITVNGSKSTYGYGDTVSCRSTADNFMYWTKTINGVREIVSTEKTYSFNAWETCTVEAVCGDETIGLSNIMRKIVFGTYTSGDLRIVVAEFIGFEDALEKGVMFGTQQIPMSTKNTQFAITNDTGEAVSVTGYAITGTSGNLSKITDGEIVAAK